MLEYLICSYPGRLYPGLPAIELKIDHTVYKIMTFGGESLGRRWRGQVASSAVEPVVRSTAA